MYKIAYYVEPEEQDREMEWLRDQKIFPTTKNVYNWKKDRWVLVFGMIVGEEALTLFKLKHELVLQEKYRQGKRLA
jgi:hypothetical protein